MSGGIIWLASYPKSGNTWLRAFLANLFTGAEQPFEIDRLSDFTMSDMRAGYFEEVARRPIAQIEAPDLNRLRPEVHRYLASRQPHTVFVKTHHAIGQVDEVATITPEVTEGAIYIVRNPLDVVVSYARHVGLELDAAIEALNWEKNYLESRGRIVFQFLSSWSEHVKSWTTAPGLTPHVMRYEDMLDDPTAAFAALVEFLGLTPEDEELQRAIRFCAFTELEAQERKSGFRESSGTSEAFFRQGRQGAWREVLTPAQVDSIVQAHAEIMAQFDYLP